MMSENWAKYIRKYVFYARGWLSPYHTTVAAYFGHPSGGLCFLRDFFMAACQFP
jgi:hypothetical protein